MNPISDPHITRFQFAGFQWPRYVATLTPLSGLRKKREGRRFTGGYYHAPTPNSNTGRGFYLDDAGQPFTRWQWADDVEGAHISHSGWFTDDYGDSEKIRGIVILLPHGRYMAGWSMGKGMASTIEPGVFDAIDEAAQMVDEHARIAAENEREYQASQNTDED
jgi:hypothetical protein